MDFAYTPEQSPSRFDALSASGNDSETKKGLRCMKLCMTFAGLYYRPLSLSPISLKFLYPLVLFLLTLAETIRQFTVYESGEGFSVRMLKILGHLFIIKILVLLLFFVVRVTPKMRKFYRNYYDYKNMYRKTVCDDGNNAKRLKQTILFGYLILMPIRTLLDFNVIIQAQAVKLWFGHYVIIDDPRFIYTLAVFLALGFTFYQFINATAFIFIYFICKIVGHEYDILTSEIESHLQKANSTHDIDDVICNFRKRFLHLSRVTQEADTIFGPITLILLIFGVVMLVFHVVGFFDLGFYGIPEVWVTLTTSLSGFDTILHLSYFLYSGLLLHCKATAIKPLLLSVDLKHRSQQFFQETFMLLQKLNSDHIGLTACGLFNINKSFIVTMVTLGLSYGIIIVRFGMMLNTKQTVLDDIISLNTTGDTVTSDYQMTAVP